MITTEASGRTIRSIEVDEGGATLWFDDGSRLSLRDTADYCCEERHMTCDDDIGFFEGAKFLGYDVREVMKFDGSHAHDCAFLLVHTSLGEFNVAAHNQHNGWYSGFSIEARVSR